MNYIAQSVLARIAYDELISKLFSLKITDMHDERVKKEYQEYCFADKKLMDLLSKQP